MTVILQLLNGLDSEDFEDDSQNFAQVNYLYLTLIALRNQPLGNEFKKDF